VEYPYFTTPLGSNNIHQADLLAQDTSKTMAVSFRFISSIFTAIESSSILSAGKTIRLWPWGWSVAGRQWESQTFFSRQTTAPSVGAIVILVPLASSSGFAFR